MEKVFFYDFHIGKIGIGEKDKQITRIFLGDVDFDGDYKIEETDLIKKAKNQLTEYFDKKRKKFNLPLLLEGTEFQQKVWKKLIEIPYGKVISYKQLAINCGNPNASRAVGNANNKNKHMIIIPCHRVIGSDGKLVGYAGGLNIKKYLLETEGSELR